MYMFVVYNKFQKAIRSMRMQSLTLSDTIKIVQTIDTINLGSIWERTVLQVNHVTCIEGQFFKTNSRETTLDRGQSKILILSMNIDQNSLETEFFDCHLPSESMCTKYWLTACSSLPRKKCR